MKTLLFAMIALLAAACGQPARQIKQAIAQVGFGGRADAGDGAAAGQALTLIGGHVRGVNQAEAGIQADVVQQPGDGWGSEAGLTGADLGRLLGSVDVHRGARIDALDVREDRRKLVGCDGAQGVRRDPQAQRHSGRASGQVGRKVVVEPQEAVDIVDEASLALRRWGAAKAAVCIEDGQERERDPGSLGGAQETGRKLQAIGVGATAGVVVQIVEFDDGGEAAAQKFDVKPGGDGFDIRRSQRRQEAIHDLAPGPKVVAGGASTTFGRGIAKPRHGALKGVAVDVDQAGQDGAAQTLDRRG